eukprot:4654598-Pleurochrysis_carterae.AAC.2
MPLEGAVPSLPRTRQTGCTSGVVRRRCAAWSRQMPLGTTSWIQSLVYEFIFDRQRSDRVTAVGHGGGAVESGWRRGAEVRVRVQHYGTARCCRDTGSGGGAAVWELGVTLTRQNKIISLVAALGSTDKVWFDGHKQHGATCSQGGERQHMPVDSAVHTV